eukprot:TRINITY_DN1058_c0_g2_i1.p1 TRINITY_DN1058_c0_g2~~TRINITY_DN1058_c0_g2_i1.p1  ORF type:complete len:405 (-),score=136.33 TRINITY_DN1058_c0_g2_i1:596-1810(-)
MYVVIVACYTQFDNLAHKPCGTPARFPLASYHLDGSSGEMTKVSVLEDERCVNPAFMRYHPQWNLVYACTETIHEDGDVFGISVSSSTKRLTTQCIERVPGKSTCYLTLDAGARHLLYVNYWDSTLGTLALSPDGTFASAGPPLRLVGQMKASHREDHLKERQSEPHAHAIVLDPVTSRIAYVPDLGTDELRQFLWDPDTGKLTAAGSVRSGQGTEPLGPRYVEFHPELALAYVVNELSSTVSVFELVESAALELVSGQWRERGEEPPKTLRFMQSVNTIPSAFPRHLNTCGRICVDPTGAYVLVSNRGHDSIVVFSIDQGSEHRGELHVASYCHTRGRTPRHFQFDPSGQWLIAANQDTDQVAVFHFDATVGKLTYKHCYDIPSPNFVCIHDINPIVRQRSAL